MRRPRPRFAAFLFVSLMVTTLTGSPLRIRAIDTLTAVLKGEESVKQIHAAEVLIEFGHADQVYARLRPEWGRHDKTPIYRVVFWRALAAATPSAIERDTLVSQLFAIAVTPGLPDRVHAIESAAKLGAPPPEEIQPALDRWAQQLPPRDVVFLNWARWSSAPPPGAAEQWINWLRSDDDITRLRAAYALRQLPLRSPATLQALADAANRAAEPDLTSAIVLASACILRASPPDIARWRTTLESLRQSGDPNIVYHALQGLMTLYDREDLVSVVPLLEHPDADVRVAAAWTVLQVDRHAQNATADGGPPR